MFFFFGAEVYGRIKGTGCVFPRVRSLVNKACLLTSLCVFLWFPTYSNASQCQIKPSNIHHLTLGRKRRKCQNPRKPVIGARLTVAAPADRYSKLWVRRSGFLTDYTINKGGYGCTTAYHRKEKKKKKGGERKGGKHEACLSFSSRCWRPEESVWLGVDTERRRHKRRDKALRHFFLTHQI